MKKPTAGVHLYCWKMNLFCPELVPDQNLKVWGSLQRGMRRKKIIDIQNVNQVDIQLQLLKYIIFEGEKKLCKPRQYNYIQDLLKNMTAC